MCLFLIDSIAITYWINFRARCYKIYFNIWACIKVCNWPTGSTIRNWDKVKTWLDNMFDKSTINSCSVASWVVEIYAWSTIWFFLPHTASTALDWKGAKIQHEFSRFCQIFYFQNIKIFKNPHWWSFSCGSYNRRLRVAITYWINFRARKFTIFFTKYF